jgi:hypothetical protein
MGKPAGFSDKRSGEAALTENRFSISSKGGSGRKMLPFLYSRQRSKYEKDKQVAEGWKLDVRSWSVTSLDGPKHGCCPS